MQGPGVNSNDFRVTTFASRLDFPLGMAKLSDGSLLVAINQGANFFTGTVKLLRFVDTNDDGVADGPGTALYLGLPSSQDAVRVAGNLILVTGQTKPITVLRAGASPATPLRWSVASASLTLRAHGSIQTRRSARAKPQEESTAY